MRIHGAFVVFRSLAPERRSATLSPMSPTTTSAIALIFACGTLAAQPSPDAATAALDRDLDRLEACLRESDAACLTALTHTELREEAARGHPRYSEIFRSIQGQAAADPQTMLRSRQFAPPARPFPAGDRLYSLIPYELGEPDLVGWRLFESFLIAVSDDGGDSWRFLDGDLVAPSRIERIIPGYRRRDLPVAQERFIPVPPASRSEYLVTSRGGFYSDGEAAVYTLDLTVVTEIEAAIDVAVLLDDPQDPDRPRQYQSSLSPGQETLEILSPVIGGFKGGRIYNVALTGTDPMTGAVLFEHRQRLLFGAGGPTTVVSSTRAR